MLLEHHIGGSLVTEISLSIVSNVFFKSINIPMANGPLTSQHFQPFLLDLVMLNGFQNAPFNFRYRGNVEYSRLPSVLNNGISMA